MHCLIHLLITSCLFPDDDGPKNFADFKEGQSFEKTFGGIPLISHFLFESKCSVDAMIEMPPSAGEGGVVPHKIKGFSENVLSIWMICEVMEFIHFHKFDW